LEAYSAWHTVTLDFLNKAFESESPNIKSFIMAGYSVPMAMSASEGYLKKRRASNLNSQLNCLISLMEILETEKELSIQPTEQPEKAISANKVFLVHGKNEEFIQTTARFLEKLDLEVVVLREQSNEGRTIIEKFIDYSDVGFAVVLLTPDDRGGSISAPYEEQATRSRQNVIFELGFFLGKLGRKRVCALYKEGVEIPSDYSGVLFVPFNESEAWKLNLAREMKAVGMDIDMNKAV